MLNVLYSYHHYLMSCRSHINNIGWYTIFAPRKHELPADHHLSFACKSHVSYLTVFG